ncbi:cell division protein PerM [Aeromicrobium sp. P5_D10]
MAPPAESSYLRAAFLTAVVAASISWLVAGLFVLIAQAGGDISLVSTFRVSVRTWLVAMGAGIDAGPVAFGLVPLGAAFVSIAVVARAARWILVDPIDDLAAFAASSAGAYGIIAATASAVSNSGDVQVSAVRAACAGFVVGGLGAAWGSVMRHGDGERWWFTTPEDVRATVRAAASGVAAVLLAATVIVAILTIRGVTRAGDLWAALDPGAGGGLVLGVGSLLAVPTLIMWTVSALIGPGFALGTDTTVDLTGAQLGQVPGFPLFAALPSPGEFPGWVFILGLLPLFAGMLCGWRLRTSGETGAGLRVLLGTAAGALAGLVLGVLVALSHGAIGPGRMADVGPPLFTPALVAMGVMAVGGAFGSALAHYRGGRASRPSDTSATGGSRLWKRHQSPSTD